MFSQSSIFSERERSVIDRNLIDIEPSFIIPNETKGIERQVLEQLLYLIRLIVNKFQIRAEGRYHRNTLDEVSIVLFKGEENRNARAIALLESFGGIVENEQKVYSNERNGYSYINIKVITVKVARCNEILDSLKLLKRFREELFTIKSSSAIPETINGEHRQVLQQLLEIMKLIRIKFHVGVEGRYKTGTPGDVSIVLLGRNSTIKTETGSESRNHGPLEFLKSFGGKVTSEPDPEHPMLRYFDAIVATIKSTQCSGVIQGLNLLATPPEEDIESFLGSFLRC